MTPHDHERATWRALTWALMHDVETARLLKGSAPLRWNADALIIRERTRRWSIRLNRAATYLIIIRMVETARGTLSHSHRTTLPAHMIEARHAAA